MNNANFSPMGRKYPFGQACPCRFCLDSNTRETFLLWFGVSEVLNICLCSKQSKTRSAMAFESIFSRSSPGFAYTASVALKFHQHSWPHQVDLLICRLFTRESLGTDLERFCLGLPFIMLENFVVSAREDTNLVLQQSGPPRMRHWKKGNYYLENMIDAEHDFWYSSFLVTKDTLPSHSLNPGKTDPAWSLINVARWTKEDRAKIDLKQPRNWRFELHRWPDLLGCEVQMRPGSDSVWWERKCRNCHRNEATTLLTSRVFGFPLTNHTIVREQKRSCRNQNHSSNVKILFCGQISDIGLLIGDKLHASHTLLSTCGPSDEGKWILFSFSEDKIRAQC